MAHGIMEYDWMLSAKERPWHGIGTVVEKHQHLKTQSKLQSWIGKSNKYQ